MTKRPHAATTTITHANTTTTNTTTTNTATNAYFHKLIRAHQQLQKMESSIDSFVIRELKHAQTRLLLWNDQFSLFTTPFDPDDDINNHAAADDSSLPLILSNCLVILEFIEAYYFQEIESVPSHSDDAPPPTNDYDANEGSVEMLTMMPLLKSYNNDHDVISSSPSPPFSSSKKITAAQNKTKTTTTTTTSTSTSFSFYALAWASIEQKMTDLALEQDTVKTKINTNIGRTKKLFSRTIDTLRDILLDVTRHSHQQQQRDHATTASISNVIAFMSNLHDFLRYSLSPAAAAHYQNSSSNNNNNNISSSPASPSLPPFKEYNDEHDHPDDVAYYSACCHLCHHPQQHHHHREHEHHARLYRIFSDREADQIIDTGARSRKRQRRNSHTTFTNKNEGFAADSSSSSSAVQKKLSYYDGDVDNNSVNSDDQSLLLLRKQHKHHSKKKLHAAFAEDSSSSSSSSSASSLSDHLRAVLGRISILEKRLQHVDDNHNNNSGDSK